MGIIERINTLREERRTLLTEADACEDMDRLHAIRDRLNAINSQRGIGILPATYTNILTVRRLI